MSAPANDAFANAVAVILNSATEGTNIGATAETGEPGNNGATVWYSWIAEISGTMIISTRASDAIPLLVGTGIYSGGAFPGGLTPTNFLSRLQVFTGASVSTLTEVTYSYISLQHAYLGLAYENADLAIFSAVKGMTYYIRIDSRNAGAANTGNFILSVFPCCARECPESFDTKDYVDNVPLAGSTTINATTLTSLGNYPKGRYVVIMASGGFVYFGFGCNAAGDSYSCDSVNFTGGAGPYNPGAPGCGGQVPIATALVNGCAFCNNPAYGFSQSNAPYVIIDHPGGEMTFEVSGYPVTWECLCNGVATCDASVGVQSGTVINVYLLTGKCGQYYPCVTIAGASINCGGFGVLNVNLNNPGNTADTYSLSLTNVVGFVPAATQITNLSPIPGGSVATFYIAAPPFGQNASATISLIDSNENTCSTFNWTADVQSGLESNSLSVNSVTGNNLDVEFGVALNSNYACAQLVNCSVSLAASGGISNPSAPLNGITFTAGQITNLPFTFTGDPSTNIYTATLNISDAHGNQIAQLEFELTSNIVASGSVNGPVNCGGVGFSFGWLSQITIKNMGNIPSYDIQVQTADPCSNGFAETVDVGVLGPGDSKTINWPYHNNQHPLFVIYEIAPDGTHIQCPSLQL